VKALALQPMLSPAGEKKGRFGVVEGGFATSTTPNPYLVKALFSRLMTKQRDF